MRTAGVVAALVVALLLQTIIAGMSLAAAALVNLVLVAVVYIALLFGAVTGLLAGAAGGLVQDALAGGVVGVGGLSKTVAGFVIGVLGSQFIVTRPLPRFLMFFAATMLHEACFHGLQALIDARPFALHSPTLLTQAAINGIVGVLAFQLVEGAPGMMQRREARGASIRRRNF